MNIDKRRYLATIALLANIPVSIADNADAIMRMPESQLMSAAKDMATFVSKGAPAQIDSGTTLLGAFFIPDTKTFMYKYQTTMSFGDEAGMQSYLVRNSCGEKTRKAFLARGIRYKHVYLTPTGEKAFYVRYSDC